MCRFLFCFCIVPIFAALPIVGEMEGYDIEEFSAEQEQLLGRFAITGDSEKTPFILKITFENCLELIGNYGNKIPLNFLKLKYVDITNASSWKTINLTLTGRGQDCFSETEFYDNLQEKYNMELWTMIDKKNTTAGTFQGRAYFEIKPKP